ncbi:MAG: hypothetical protein ACLRZZ_15635 [Enterocloster sp.]
MKVVRYGSSLTNPSFVRNEQQMDPDYEMGRERIEDDMDTDWEEGDEPEMGM